jgi:hypothetical protein
MFLSVNRKISNIAADEWCPRKARPFHFITLETSNEGQAYTVYYYRVSMAAD